MTEKAAVPATVFVVDDEPELRRALCRLLQAEGLAVECFDSAAAFLEGVGASRLGCIVLDVAMPGIDGLELQQRLAAHADRLPIVFLTGHGDIPMSVRAMKVGAVDFLTKPVKRAELLRAITAGLERAHAWRASTQASAEARTRLATLTPREHEVFAHVIAGKLNKVIAADLGTSEQTIKVHRGRVMDKLGVDSIAELVRLAQLLDVPPAA